MQDQVVKHSKSVGFGNTNYETFGGSQGEFGIQKLENPHRAKSLKFFNDLLMSGL
jgi:hypothetical protein